jgi:transcriptional regulator with XRE-family HTH domain
MSEVQGAQADRSASSTLLQTVGVRVRALRLDRKLTLDELSALSGVSRRMIALLEAGEANVSLATLDKLARALGRDFASLVVAHPAVPLVPETSQHAAPVWEDTLGSAAQLLISHPRAGTTELWQWALVPGARYQAEPDPPGSEEMVLVTSGHLTIEVGEDKLSLGPGDYLRLPTDRPYAYGNTARTKVHFVCVAVTP